MKQHEDKKSEGDSAPKPSLKELMKNTDFEAQRNDTELKEWSEKKPVGREKND